jgi:opacity protein-like surface antigen
MSAKALMLASVLALAPQFSHAADLLPPPPMLEAPMLRGTVGPDTSGWYLRGDVGVGINQIRSATSQFLPGSVVPSFQYDYKKLGSSANIGFGVGYQFNNWFRADITGEYRGSAQYNAVASYDGNFFFANPCGGLARCPDIYTGSVSSAVFMANGYVDLGTWAGLTPYVGVGVGIANNKFSNLVDQSIGNSGFGYSSASSKTNFAWAAMAGLSYAVSQNLKLEMGYRYLNLGTASSGAIICQPVGLAGCPQEVQKLKIASQDFRIGMRWMINDTPSPVMQAPMMQPLVRKY